MKAGVLITFAGRKCGGPEVYERELIRALTAIPSRYEFHLYCLDRRAKAVIGVAQDRVIYHQLSPAMRTVSMTATLPRVLARTRPDVFHAPIVPPPFCPKNTIMAMACSSLIRHPEFYPPLIRLRLRFLLHREARKAPKIICPSRHVRDVVQQHFHLPDDRMKVVYPGASRIFRVLGESEKQAYLKKIGVKSPFFLFSGRWENRKNVVRTLEAFALFRRTYRTAHKFVFTGGHSWNAAEAKAIIVRLGLEDSVIDIGKSEFDELPLLYGAADALVYASLWEGFGMPIVEAMACGTPVITSNVSAMPETAGGNALLVDPQCTEEIADAMHRISTDTILRERLRSQGPRHAQQFTWEQAARDTLQVYEEVRKP